MPSQSESESDQIRSPKINLATQNTTLFGGARCDCASGKRLLRASRPDLRQCTDQAEFVVHCPVNRPGMALPGAVERREADFLAFTSIKVTDEIKSSGVKLVNWKDLVNLKRAGPL